MTRWRGLAELVQDAVHHGTLAVERVHQRVARTPLEILAHVPPLATPAQRIATFQAAAIGATYTAIRGVNGAVGAAAAIALEAMDARRCGTPADAR
jgi:hypothetical protein